MRLATCFVVLWIAVATQQPAHAVYCLNDTDDWTGYTLIPVKYSSSLPPLLHHANGISWTEAEFTAEVRHVLQKINDYNNSRMPFLYFAGVAANETPEQNVIKFVPKPPNMCGFDATCNGGPANGCIITVARYNCSGPGTERFYEPFLLDYPANDTANTLTHELGHTLGLEHPGDCYPEWECSSLLCSVMSYNSGLQEENAWFIDDTDGFRAQYGGLSYDGVREHYERLSSSWYLLTSSAVPLRLPLPGLSDGAGGGSYMTMTSRGVNGSSVSFHRWVHSTQTWTSWGALPPRGVGGLGAAYTLSNNTGYFMFQETENDTVTDKRLNWTKLTGFSGSPPSYLGHADTTTRRHGIDGTFDPKSGKLVFVNRAVEVPGETEHWQAVVYLVDPATNTHLNGFALLDGPSLPLMVGDTPSVACAPSSVEFNCILVWEEAAQPGNSLGTHLHLMRSMQFKFTQFFGVWILVPTTPVAIGPTTSSAYIAYGRPEVTYRGPVGSSTAFEVVWADASSVLTRTPTRSMSKSTVETAAWHTLRTVPDNNLPRTSPSIGSAFEHTEMIRHRRP